MKTVVIKMNDVVDISYYQSKIIDVDALVKRSGGVILRLGYTGWGSLHNCCLDSKFNQFYSQLKDKTKLGVYYFTLAYSDVIVNREVSFITEKVKGLDLQLRVWIDVEGQTNCKEWTNLSRADRTKYIGKLLEGLKKNGVDCGIYASTSWLNSKLNMNTLKGWPIWVAQYAAECQYKGQYEMWQYSNKADGKSYGLNSQYVDISHVYTNYGYEYTEGEKLMADDVISGMYGNGDARKENIYKRVQSCVNEKMKNV